MLYKYNSGFFLAECLVKWFDFSQSDLFHGIYFNMCLVKWILTLNCSRSSYTFPKQLEQDQPERGSLSAEAKGVKLWEVLCRSGEVGKSSLPGPHCFCLWSNMAVLRGVQEVDSEKNASENWFWWSQVLRVVIELLLDVTWCIQFHQTHWLTSPKCWSCTDWLRHTP